MSLSEGGVVMLMYAVSPPLIINWTGWKCAGPLVSAPRCVDSPRAVWNTSTLFLHHSFFQNHFHLTLLLPSSSSHLTPSKFYAALVRVPAEINLLCHSTLKVRFMEPEEKSNRRPWTTEKHRTFVYYLHYLEPKSQEATSHEHCKMVQCTLGMDGPLGGKKRGHLSKECSV